MKAATPDGLRRTSVSQTPITNQPARMRARRARASRARFAAIFGIQYAAFARCLSWPLRRFQLRPCQKSPSQNTARRSLGKTRSGLPGRVLTFFRYRRPRRHSARRSIISGVVSMARLACFVRELVGEAGVKPLKLGLRTSVDERRGASAESHGTVRILLRPGRPRGMRASEMVLRCKQSRGSVKN